MGPDAESAGVVFGIAKLVLRPKDHIRAIGQPTESATVVELAMSCGRQRFGTMEKILHNFRQFVFAIVCARWTAVQISPVKCLKMLKSREAGLLIEHQEV